MMDKKSDDHLTAWPARRRDAKDKERMGRAGVVLIVCLFTLPFLVFLFGGRAGALAVCHNAARLTATGGGLLNVSPPSATGADELFGGLLAPGSDRRVCLSRYQSPHYYKHSPYAPSPHLLQKLRDYEARGVFLP